MRDSINRYWLLAISLICVVTALICEPVAQDPAYHQFADTRTLFGIANFWNVATNLAFVVGGALGLRLLLSSARPPVVPGLRLAYPVFFLGILLTGFGSAAYHLAPDNATLVWDRLPMTLAFIAFFCIVLGEHICANTARLLFWPSLLAGLLSVLYWYYTETRQQGDLRPYLLVQFLPVLLTPLILLLFKSRYSHAHYFWGMLLLYMGAKYCELYDREFYELVGFSGHSIKHLLAGGGALVFYRMLSRRHDRETDNDIDSEADPATDSLTG